MPATAKRWRSPIPRSGTRLPGELHPQESTCQGRIVSTRPAGRVCSRWARRGAELTTVPRRANLHQPTRTLRGFEGSSAHIEATES
jgi:hypothetical protein